MNWDNFESSKLPLSSQCLSNRSEAMALMNPSFPSINDSPPVNPFLARYADSIPL